MKFFKRTDLAVIALILALAGVFYSLHSARQKKTAAYAEIYYYNTLVETVALSTGEERTFSVKEAPNVLFRLYEDGAICFLSSDCPDKICVNTGLLSEVDQMAACLPNGLVLKIVSLAADELGADIAIG